MPTWARPSLFLLFLAGCAGSGGGDESVAHTDGPRITEPTDAAIFRPDLGVRDAEALDSAPPDADLDAAPDAFVKPDLGLDPDAEPDVFVPDPDVFVPDPDAFIPNPDVFVPDPDAFIPDPDAQVLTGPRLVINEVDYDQPGSDDTAEFIELYNAGDEALSLGGLRLELVNGSNNQVYGTIPLDGVLAAGAYLVIGDAAALAAVAATAPSARRLELTASHFPDGNAQIQNGGPDGLRLMDASGKVNGLCYAGQGMPDTADGTCMPDDDGSATDNQGLSRCPNGVDTGDNRADFSLADSTPGLPNDCP